MQSGTILFHKGFVFADGAVADKFLIVLGGTASHLIVTKTTSNGARYRIDHGCQAGNRFPAFLLTLGCCCLPKNTWICLGDFYELAIAELHSKMFSGDVYRFGTLSPDLTRDVQVCAAGCDDISQQQEQVVRSCFVNAP